MEHFIDVGLLPNNETKSIPLGDDIALDKVLWVDGFMENVDGLRTPLPYRWGDVPTQHDVLLSIDKGSRTLEITTGKDRTDWKASVRIVTRD